MNDTDKDVLGCFGAILWVVLLFVVSALMNGWAFVQLWEWFILPVFEAAPVVTIVQAIGLSVFIGFLSAKKVEAKSDKSKSVTDLVIESFAVAIGMPLMAVGFGWLVTLFL